MLNWLLFKPKKILFIKDSVLQFESNPRRNYLSLLVVSWLWDFRSDIHNSEIVGSK